MAKLGTYYGLCPLIDHRSLFGITPDEESGVVIVTLGKNIAVKYKLSDQKQCHSWRTKDRFSSPIIYDSEECKYVAVFNENFIRVWTGNEEHLDKIKKIKFNQQIYSLFLCEGQGFIVFKNGAVKPLREAIEKRKELDLVGVIEATDYISDLLYNSLNGETYVGLVVTSQDNTYLTWAKFKQPDKFYKINLHREDASLTGYLFHVDSSSMHFLSLWNDGRIYSVELKESDLDSSNLGELFTVVEAISCKDYVAMTSLDQNYIALYGCNSNDEGALLVIYNVQFKVIQSRQPFKLFSNGAKIWRINDNLLFPVGQNLAVIQFHLDTEQLAALVGSHKVVESDPDVSIVQKLQYVSWNPQSSFSQVTTPEIFKSQISDFLSQGLSENQIFENLLADIVKEENLDAIPQLLSYFDNVPESGLIQFLKLILNWSKFRKNTTISSPNFPQELQPLQRTELLDLVFTKPFNESLILPHLRSLLTINEVLNLFQYICFLLSDNGHNLPRLDFVETESKLIEWSCVLLDANYQKFLLTRDDKVNEMISLLRSHIKEELSCSNDLKEVLSLMYELRKGKLMSKAMHTSGLNYTVEEFPLY